MVPTVLDALGIEPPATIKGVTQSPIEGVSLVSSFEDAKAPDKHITQYFEMMGHRSLYHDGWRAVCPWPGTSFTESGRKFGDVITFDMLTKLDATGWELYHVAEDFAETKNLADKERERLIAMIGMWYNEAGRYNVLPIDSRGTQRIAEERPAIAVGRNRYTLYPNTQAIVAAAAAKTLNRPHSFTAEVEIPKDGADGVLLSMGGNDGGFSFYVQDGKLCYLHNYVALDYFYVKAKDKLPAGKHFLSMQFEPTGKPDIKNGKGVPAKVTLLVDGKPIVTGEMPHTVPNRLGQGGAMIVGADPGAPVNPEYKPPFKFTGTLKRVIVDVSGEHVVDHEAEMRVAMAKQ
jgi:arylsulfatase